MLPVSLDRPLLIAASLFSKHLFTLHWFDPIGA
jgi:hypothetical protein